jgi:hypothetical protein
MASSNFELKQAIENYISLILKQGSITSSDKNELTGHLIDSTEVLLKQGLSEEEAFMIACKRIGKVELLSDEYRKVNTSLSINPVWPYLLVGVNIFYGISSITLIVIKSLYFVIYKQYDTSVIAVLLVTLINLIFMTCLWTIVKYNREIAYYIEKQIEKKPLNFIALTFIPITITILFSPLIYKLMPGISIKYPIYMFNSGLTEFTFYLATMSVIVAFLSLVFSINKTASSTAKAIFKHPSFAFLLLFGLAIELTAASTRALHVGNIVIQAFLFGSVYAVAAFLIAYYNEISKLSKYLLTAITLGFILEISVGVRADIVRGGTYFTAYFGLALVFGVLLGRFLGIKLSKNLKNNTAEIS